MANAKTWTGFLVPEFRPPAAPNDDNIQYLLQLQLHFSVSASSSIPISHFCLLIVTQKSTESTDQLISATKITMTSSVMDGEASYLQLIWRDGGREAEAEESGGWWCLASWEAA